MPLSFDDILGLAARKGPLEYAVKAWDGKTVLVRDPSSADVDEWRMYCRKNQDKIVPFSAKLCQIMLCDEAGERSIPQDEESLQALADGNPRAIDEIAKFCLPMVNDPGDEEIEELQKN